MLDWGKKDEFVQAMFRRSHSVHSRRFYEVALRKFGAFCRERRIDDVNDWSVYEVLNGFIAWNDAGGIRPKTIIDYLSGVKRFMLYQDIEIDENRYRNRVVLAAGHEDRRAAPDAQHHPKPALARETKQEDDGTYHNSGKFGDEAGRSTQPQDRRPRIG